MVSEAGANAQMGVGVGADTVVRDVGGVDVGMRRGNYSSNLDLARPGHSGVPRSSAEDGPS